MVVGGGTTSELFKFVGTAELNIIIAVDVAVVVVFVVTASVHFRVFVTAKLDVIFAVVVVVASTSVLFQGAPSNQNKKKILRESPTARMQF